MNPKNNNMAILAGLKNIPQDSRILEINSPCAWFIYIEISPEHCYYIAMEKKEEGG